MADCHSSQAVGPTSSSSGGAAARSCSIRSSPGWWFSEAQAKPMIIHGSSPIPKSGGSTRKEMIGFISSGRSCVQRPNALSALFQRVGR